MLKPKRVGIASSRAILQRPLVTAQGVVIGNRREVIVLLDRKTLRPIWTIEDEDYRAYGQAIDDETMTVGFVGGAGVRALRDGRLLWTTEDAFSGADVWRKLVVTFNDGRIACRDSRTSTVVKEIEVSRTLTSLIRICGDLYVLRGEGPSFLAVDIEKRKVAWERDLLTEMRQRLPVETTLEGVRLTCGTHEGTYVAFYSGATFGGSVADGSIAWMAPIAAPDAWPTVHQGRVYFMYSDRFIAIDEDTGAIVWDIAHPEVRAFREKEGTVYKDRIAITNESGHLAVFDLADGRLVTVHDAKVSLWRSAEADGRLFVATSIGDLLVYDESIWGL